MTAPDEELAHALVAYVDGARRFAWGALHEDTTIQLRGCSMMSDARAVFERLKGDLDILIPLLKHDHPFVRLWAARNLMDDHYELVLPVLHDLDENSTTTASDDAATYLQLYGEPNRGSGWKKPDPRYFNRKPKPRVRPS